MALSANTVLEVRADGSDNNGGGFVTGATGIDRSQQASAHATLTTASTVHTTTTQINLAVGDFTVSAADVGNLYQSTGGTATAGTYQITAVDVGNNRWTVDRAVGTAGQTTSGAMGGALASAGKAASLLTVSGMFGYVRAGSYSISSTSSNVSNGRITLSTSNTGLIGYYTTRGDDSNTRPILTATVNTMTLVTISNACFFGNFNLSAGSATGITGLTATTQGVIYNCKMTGANSSFGFRGQANSAFIRCGATGGTVTGFRGEGGHFFGCAAVAIAARGFDMGGNDSVCSRCISVNHTGGNGKGFDLSAAGGSAVFINCTASGCAADCFDNSAAPKTACNYINCLAWNGSANGFSRNARAFNCAAGSNTTADFGTTVTQFSCVTLTDDPFTDTTALDFALNSVDGGGADCVGQGIPGAFPDVVATSGTVDIGAVQKLIEDTASSGTVNSLHFLLALPKTPSSFLE